jgi:excisionase family DNA binding protein
MSGGQNKSMENRYSPLHEFFRELFQEVLNDALTQQREMLAQKESRPPGLLEDTISADEAAQLLRIAKQTLYTLTSRKKIPFYKNGKKIFFRRSELDDWMARGKSLDEHAMRQEAQKYIRNHSKQG